MKGRFNGLPRDNLDSKTPVYKGPARTPAFVLFATVGLLSPSSGPQCPLQAAISVPLRAKALISVHSRAMAAVTIGQSVKKAVTWPGRHGRGSCDEGAQGDVGRINMAAR